MDSVNDILAFVGIVIFLLIMIGWTGALANFVVSLIVWIIKNLWWAFLIGAAWYMLTPQKK